MRARAYEREVLKVRDAHAAIGTEMESAPDDIRRESALTLVEILVVLVIILILMSLGLYGVSSARRSGNTVMATSVAQAYADAADRFAREHDGFYPAAPGESGPTGMDWEGGAGAARGPKSDTLGQRKFYLRSIPEAVQDERVVFGSGGSAIARIEYVSTTNRRGYTLRVTVDDQPPCSITGGNAADSGRQCSRR